MFGDGALTFQEFAMGEPLPLATIHDAVLEFLRDRDDAALYGAQAVNAYVSEPRMTQDVDVVSPRAADVTPAELIAGKGAIVFPSAWAAQGRHRLARSGHAPLGIY